MTQEHPITPPPELVKQFCDKAISHAVDGAKRGEVEVWLIQEAFRAGADQELEACCEYLVRCAQWEPEDIAELRAARRPKPPSLKEQALALLDPSNTYGSVTREDEYRISVAKAEIIRRALEQLDG
jgi:hypothetical protein